MRIGLHSGAVVGRYLDRGDDKTVVVVTLKSADWDALTAHLKDLDRFCTDDPDWPDMTLEARIEHFVDMEVLEWLARLWIDDDQAVDVDLNDDVPF